MREVKREVKIKFTIHQFENTYIINIIWIGENESRVYEMESQECF